jgi:hypothetical protein
MIQRLNAQHAGCVGKRGGVDELIPRRFWARQIRDNHKQNTDKKKRNLSPIKSIIGAVNAVLKD